MMSNRGGCGDRCGLECATDYQLDDRGMSVRNVRYPPSAVWVSPVPASPRPMDMVQPYVATRTLRDQLRHKERLTRQGHSELGRRSNYSRNAAFEQSCSHQSHDGY